MRDAKIVDIVFHVFPDQHVGAHLAVQNGASVQRGPAKEVKCPAQQVFDELSSHATAFLIREPVNERINAEAFSQLHDSRHSEHLSLNSLFCSAGGVFILLF